MLRIVPLGGLGEIGLNAMVFETETEAFLVDCGIMFPRGDTPGVDVVLPDLSYLREIDHKLKGVVLTHGHEDHVGALPFLLRERPLPVWGSSFTLGLLAPKLQEMGIASPSLHELAPGGRAVLGKDFEVEGIRMTHSVPDALGLVIDTPEGSLVHSGDFKLDPTPVVGPPSDLGRLEEVGRRGVLALLSDSTNSDRKGSTKSEREVARALDPLFAGAKGRVVVATFASNIHRIQQIVDASVRHGRKVALFGRSVEQNVNMALAMGFLRAEGSTFLDPGEVQGKRRSEVTVIASGSQGEPRSALRRLAAGDPSMPFSLEEGDLAILSSTAIPGNELAVADVINGLMALGIEVVFGERVHASGHASQEEQRRLIETIRPSHFVPVHGELRHLVLHGRTAEEAGVPQDACHVITDGHVLAFEGGRARREGEVPTGRIFVDRQAGAPLAHELLRERSRMAESGVVTAVVLVDRVSGDLVRGPEIVTQGIPSPEETGLRDGIREEVRRALQGLAPPARSDREAMREEVRLAVRRVFRRASERRPVVLPVVIEL